MENGTAEENTEGMSEGKTGVKKLEQDLLKRHCLRKHLTLDI